MKFVNILYTIYLLFFFFVAPVFLSQLFLGIWSFFWGSVIGIFLLVIAGFLDNIFSFPSAKILFIWPRTLIKKLVFGVIHIFVVVVHRDTFVMKATEVSQLFQDVWGPTLEAQGFISYGYRLYKWNKGSSSNTYYLRDTSKGYLHVIRFLQHTPGHFYLCATAVPDSFIIRNTPHTKYLEFASSLERPYLDRYDKYIFGKQEIKHLLQKSLETFLSEGYLQQFSEIPKPFDTIRPKDILEHPTLIKSLMKDSPWGAPKDQCMRIIKAIAESIEDEQLFTEAEEALKILDAKEKNML